MYNNNMRDQFDIAPTKEELAFTRRHFLRDVEYINSEPFAVLTFASYWNFTNGAENPFSNCEPYDKLCELHKNNSILFNANNKNTTAWNNAVLENRNWLNSLSAGEKTKLLEFDSYAHWQPFLMKNDPMSINGYLKLFPNISNPEEIPDIVRKYENPNSPDALPGAVDIDTHDAIHILLGRGALQADEAFVIGFTMGGASNKLTEKHFKIFTHALTEEYPAPFKIEESYIPSYLIGVTAGSKYFNATKTDLSTLDFSHFRDVPINNLRAALGIDIEHLSELYKDTEAKIIPAGNVTSRNHTHITRPENSHINPRKILG